MKGYAMTGVSAVCDNEDLKKEGKWERFENTFWPCWIKVGKYIDYLR